MPMKMRRKRRLNLFKPQFLWPLPLLLLAKQDCSEAKQSSQNEPSNYRFHTIVVGAVLYISSNLSAGLYRHEK